MADASTGGEGKYAFPKRLTNLGAWFYIDRRLVPILFPGSSCYPTTNSTINRICAIKRFTEALDSIQYLTWHHDVGSMIGSSYSNIYRLNPNSIQESHYTNGQTSMYSFPPKGWSYPVMDRGWQSKRGWTCPVIIDNMMNPELLFEANRLSGDSTALEGGCFWACKQDIRNQFRKDGSCYRGRLWPKQRGRFT